MITTVALALLLQDQDVDAWLRGDDKARERLLKAGPACVFDLRKARAKSEAKVDALLADIKKSGAGDVAAALDASRTLNIPASTYDAVYELHQRAGIPLMADPAMLASFRGSVSVPTAEREAWKTLDEICRQSGLDWGVFHGVVVVSTPERLWPPPAKPVRTLTDDEKSRAAKWIDELDREAMEERDAASAELRKLGTAAVPLLQAAAERGSPERAARCRALVKEATVPAWEPVFGKAAAERQKLEGADADLMRKAREETSSIKVIDIRGNGFYKLLLQPRQMSVVDGPALREKGVTVDGQNLPTWAIVAVVAQANGWDVAVRDGRFVIDAKADIARMIAEWK